MSIHTRAWQEGTILIFGLDSGVPMRLEQAIAHAAPTLEDKLESFEIYEDAIDYAKKSKNLGLCVICESNNNLRPGDLITEFGKAAGSNSLFGILLFKNTETIQGLKEVLRSPNILSYANLEAFLDPAQIPIGLANASELLQKKYFERLIPTPLEETLFSLAKQSTDEDSLIFIDRVSTILASNLNISWKERAALKWIPILNAVAKLNPAAIEPHLELKQLLIPNHETSPLPSDIPNLVSEKSPLHIRASRVAIALNHARLTGTLDSNLNRLAAQSAPGAPAILRHLARSKQTIVEIANSTKTASLKLVSG